MHGARYEGSHTGYEPNRGNPEKTLKQTFEEIEEIRRRVSGDGRTNGNAGPQDV